jgi:hypothetical protein
MCTRDWETQTGLNCVGVNNTPGANHIAAFYKADEAAGLIGSTANTVITNIIAYGLMHATTTCEQGSYVRQSVSISCDEAKGNKVSTNKNCTYCKSQIERVIQDRLALEEQASSYINSTYVPQKFTADQLHDLRSTCNYVCTQCLVIDLRQELSANMTAECDVTSNTFQKAFIFGMQNQAKIEVARNKQRLQQLGQDVETQNQIDNFSLTMVDSIRNIVTSSTLNSLKQKAIIVQDVVVEPDSTSVVIQNLSQRLSLVMYSTLVASEISQARMYVAIDYATKSKVLELQSQLDQFISKSSYTGLTVYNLLVQVVKQIPSIFIVLFSLLILIAFYWTFAKAGGSIMLHANGHVLDALSDVHDVSESVT